MKGTATWLRHPHRSWRRWRNQVKHLKELAEYSREHDPAENAESTPPADEEIRLHAIWLAESYPPSFFDVLLEAVKRLAADSGHTPGGPPAQRIEEALRLGSSGSFPLGPIVRPGSRLYALASPIETALPAEVEYAHASVHYLVPSHAVLVVCFVADQAGSARVEQALRATYHTYTSPHRNWTAIHGPGDQKREAIRVKRAERLTALTGFFDREAPGLFTSDGRLPPSIEFWTTKERKPFADERGAAAARSLHDFVQLLGWRPWTNVWFGPDNLALKEAPLSGDDFWSRAPNLQLVAREADLFAGDDLAMYGGRSREAYYIDLAGETFREEADLLDARLFGQKSGQK